ncbi:hypothetical protein D9M68_688420 [compost metagenome]
MPAALLRAQGVEAGRHARPHAAHVGFGDLGPHGHGAEVGDAQQVGGLVGGVQGLALARFQRDHGAAHRRIDAGIAELGHVAVQGRLGLLDLGAQPLDARGRGLQRGLGGLHVFLAGGVVAGQVALARVLLCGQAVQRLLLGQLRLEAGQLGAAGVDGGTGHAGVDLGEQLAFLHVVADVHVQVRDLARDLRADVDIAERMQRAQRGHAAGDVAAGNRHSIELRAAVGMPPSEGAGGCQGQRERRGQPQWPAQARAAGRRILHVRQVRKGSSGRPGRCQRRAVPARAPGAAGRSAPASAAATPR